jgi:hypothetical protein
VTGAEFAICPSVEKVRVVVEKVVVEPIATWFVEVELAQNAKVAGAEVGAAEPMRVGGADIAARIDRVIAAGGFGAGEALPLRSIAEGTLDEENL